MKNQWTLLTAILSLGLTFQMTHAALPADQLECPDPSRITVISDVQSIPWLAPKLSTSARYGIGYGGENVGELYTAFSLAPISPSWVCVYKTTKHASLAGIQSKQIEPYMNEILKRIPNAYEYGLLLYSSV